MYDIIIIGSGPAGYPAAIKAAKVGLKVAIIEKEELGGICLNWGCIPTKALLHAAEKFLFIKEKAKNIGINCSNISFDFPRIIEYSREKVAKLNSGINYLLNKYKVELIRDTAELLPSQSGQNKKIKLLNSLRSLEAKNVIIATGIIPKALKGLEFDHKNILDYRDALSLKELPKSLLIIGSGAIGIEFASFYNAFGTEVTVIEMQKYILPTEDEEISSLAHKIFLKKGIKIYTDTMGSLSANAKEQSKPLQVSLNIQGESKAKEITVEKILVAAGTIANSASLGLENFPNIKLENGFIKTNEFMETGEKNIYAIGDITGAPCLAHKALHEALLCIEKIIGKKKVFPINKNNIPSCIYSFPQIASVGLNEAKAKEKGYTIKIGRARAESNGKSVAISETEGLIKTIFDAKTGELLGAHMLGHEVTEMIQGYVIAKNLETTEEDLKHIIFPHPTVSEIMHEAVLAADGEEIH